MADVSLKSIVGNGYTEFWQSQARYRVVKGGRGSKKSCTAALWFIYNLMKYPLANTLVVRRYFNGHKDSTYAQLKWATHRLGVSNLWQCSKSPLEMTFKPTGQKIIFRGMDDPQSITSIAVEKGVLCWVWVEEAFQIESEDAFNKLDMSIRGEMPKGYFKQITLTFNPWSAKHWLKNRFFDVDNANIFARTTNYKCNEWLDDMDIAIFNEMHEKDPTRYAVEGLGAWGISQGLIYKNFAKDEKRYLIAKDKLPKLEYITIGIDFGGNKSNHAFVASGTDKNFETLYALKSWSLPAKDTNVEYIKAKYTEFAEAVTKEFGEVDYSWADSAEQAIINSMRTTTGVYIRNSVKNKILQRIRCANILMAYDRFKIVNHSNADLINGLQNAIWDPKKDIDTRLDDGTSDIDVLDAWEYSWEFFIKQLLRG
ncbi:MAG: PBSX family phage terminase large subunit [Clostridiales bacterium]